MFPLVPFQAFERQPGGLSLLFVKVDPNAEADVAAIGEKGSPDSTRCSPDPQPGRVRSGHRDYQLITAADRATTIVAIRSGRSS